ncbi:hypothetical protein GWK47_036597 [Chionoecetes opilio]|uniref:Uncharacterized protein n=1 Tax=Chionoecetes opilio TaxID=41210 RepID=A0A8J5CYZ3_CHIOP|nr:hypothetical protein GWK47_036597 [Chionoecetes opilio]
MISRQPNPFCQLRGPQARPGLEGTPTCPWGCGSTGGCLYGRLTPGGEKGRGPGGKVWGHDRLNPGAPFSALSACTTCRLCAPAGLLRPVSALPQSRTARGTPKKTPWGGPLGGTPRWPSPLRNAERAQLVAPATRVQCIRALSRGQSLPPRGGGRGARRLRGPLTRTSRPARQHVAPKTPLATHSLIHGGSPGPWW